MVVVWTVDTLGAEAAQDTNWCGRLGEILAAHGRDVACLEGAISPASWTGEAHTRLLWPQHLAGELRPAERPACGARSVLETLSEAKGMDYLFGADNPVFRWLAPLGTDADCDGQEPWVQGTNASWLSVSGVENMLADEADTPVHEALESVRTRLRHPSQGLIKLPDATARVEEGHEEDDGQYSCR